MQLDIRLDNTGFPMVYSYELGAFIHWMPMTKIQLEYFLAATNDATFGEDWYYELNKLNARISPNQIRGDNYWQTLATGIKPRETLRYAVWAGRDYDLPTLEEWRRVYQEMDRIAYDTAHLQQILNTKGLKERPKNLIDRLARAMPQDNGMGLGRSLADQMLLRQGIMEYVYEDNNRNTFAGMGLTNPSFVGGFRQPDDPQVLNNPSEGSRMRNYGFRLIYRGA